MYTQEPCSFGSSSCISPRKCRWSYSLICEFGDLCECHIPGDPQVCQDSGDCLDGDLCYEDDVGLRYCLSARQNLLVQGVIFDHPINISNIRPVESIGGGDSATLPMETLPEEPLPTKQSESPLIIGEIVGGLVFIVVIILLICFRKRIKSMFSSQNQSPSPNNLSNDDEDDFLNRLRKRGETK